MGRQSLQTPASKGNNTQFAGHRPLPRSTPGLFDSKHQALSSINSLASHFRPQKTGFGAGTFHEQTGAHNFTYLPPSFFIVFQPGRSPWLIIPNLQISRLEIYSFVFCFSDCSDKEIIDSWCCPQMKSAHGTTISRPRNLAQLRQGLCSQVTVCTVDGIPETSG